MRNKELTFKERCQIEALLKENLSFRDISKNLGKGKSTIAEEINRNKGRENYCAEKAQRRRYWKRYRAKRGSNKIALDRHLSTFVEKGLQNHLSPETISDRLDRQSGLKYASPKSIRKYINKRPGLERFLFWERVKKKRGPKKKKSGEKLTDRKFIEERPEEAEYDYGHWEGDFIVSKHNAFCLLVLVEKKTKKTLIRLIPCRNNDLVNNIIVEMLSKYTVKSLTLDNDIAFNKHKILEEKLGSPIYFCHPYHSWEKGLVENMNRWIRVYIPKKTNLALIAERDLVDLQNWLNYNPRQCLEGYSPVEKLMKYEYNINICTHFVKPPSVRIGG